MERFNPSKEEITRFCYDIEAMVLKSDMDYIDAILEVCSKYNIDIDMVSALINPTLKAKIEFNAIQRNLLKGKGAQLPI